jgi:hypothetical protein
VNFRALAPALLGLAVALAAGGFAWRAGQRADAAHAHAAALERDLAQTRSALKNAQERADALAAKAVELDTQLGSVKSRATATETKSSQLNRELASVKSSLGERQQREVALLAELESLRQQVRAAAPSTAPQPAAVETPPAPPAIDAPPAAEVAPLQRRIATLEAQLTELLTRALAEPAAEPPLASATPADSSAAPTADAPPAFRVVRVGPRDAFVVLDYGSDHGASVGESLTLARGNSTVGRVQLSDVRPRFSVAQVIAPPHKGQLQTGDIVLLGR